MLNSSSYTYLVYGPQRREEFEEKAKNKLKELEDGLTDTVQPGENLEFVKKNPL
jgi:hypothetical protein